MDYTLNGVKIEQALVKVKDSILPSEKNNYKSKFLQSNLLLYFVVLLLVLKIGAALVTINLPQNTFFADITKSSLESFVNQTRQSVGLQPLTPNSKLEQAAQEKAQDMLQNQYFDHTSPSGVSPWFWFSKSGYSYKYAGENLAIGFYDSQEVYNAWLNSPSHKANIVNPNYTEVGTVVLSGFGPNKSIIVVQEFASPMPVKVATPKVTNTKPVATTKPKVTPTPKPVEPTPAVVQQTNNEKVLSQTTQSVALTAPNEKTVTNSLSLRVLNSIAYNYEKFLQDAVYGVSLIVIGILLTLIFLNFRVSFKRELVFRAALIVILLSLATAINKEVVIAMIPHQIII